MISNLAKLLLVVMPWPIRRFFLARCFGYELHPTSRIGISWVFPKELKMEEDAQIGHLTVCKGLSTLHMGAHSYLGNLNWITGFPREKGGFFEHKQDRQAALILEQHSSVTHRHLIDCTDLVTIGKFTTVAGFHSKILTHTIDLKANRQTCEPVTIGGYCFLGTNCTVLNGSKLPDYSVLGAGAVLHEAFTESYKLYAGVPAKPVKELPKDMAYFTRDTGFVN